MKHLLLLTSLLLPLCAFAGSPTADEIEYMALLRKMRINIAMNVGMEYQLAYRCGAGNEALEKYETKVTSDAELKKPSYDSLKVDFRKTYAEGKKLGDKRFESLGADAISTYTCKQALEALR